MNPYSQIIETDDGSLTLMSQEASQTYHSQGGAKWEARELYCKASQFEKTLNDSSEVISVLDVGLGLGYNALSSIIAWLQSSGCRPLKLVSLEAKADLCELLLRGSGTWQQNWDQEWLDALSRFHWQRQGSLQKASIRHPVSQSECHWSILIADASQVESLAPLEGHEFQYIWQDPFSPEKNPLMWSTSWFQSLLKFSVPETCMMTYSVARSVKDALKSGGWNFERIKAAGPKRHWLRASPAALNL